MQMVHLSRSPALYYSFQRAYVLVARQAAQQSRAFHFFRRSTLDHRTNTKIPKTVIIHAMR